MPSYEPAKKNTAFITYVSLVSQANGKLFQVNPTLSAGDVKVSIDGGALANLGTLPAVTPAASVMVKVSLSAAEMNGDNISVVFSDAAGSEWNDMFMNIQTVARQMDDLAYPATSGRSMVVDAAGLVDANAVKLGPTGTGTAQTARDIGASVLLSAGAGAGQLDFTSGVVKANATQVLGGTIPTPNVTGVPLVDLKYTLGTLSPATAGSVRADAVTGAVGSVTAGVTVTTNNDKTGYTVAVGGIPASGIVAAEKNSIADSCLDRRLDVGVDSSADTTTGRTWRSALRQLRNKASISAGTLTVCKEDDTTTSHTAAVTTTAGNPISTIDPA